MMKLQNFCNEKGLPFEYGSDFGGTDETVLSESFDKPVMVHRYPAAVKAFYMQPDPEDPTKHYVWMCLHLKDMVKLSEAANEFMITIC